MKSIAWITASSFIDVDLSIINSLNSEKNLKIFWHLIFVKNEKSTFKFDEINSKVSSTSLFVSHLILKKRLSSVKTLFIFLDFLLKIKKSKPDILYVNADLEPYFSILIRLFFNPKNLIISIHDVKPHSGQSKIVTFFSKIKVKLFYNFHVFSKTQQIIFLKKNMNKKCFLIPLFLQDYGISKSVPQSLKISFLFFGTIRENKGLEYLILASNKLNSFYKGKFEIIIFGKCVNWSFYKQIIEHEEVFNISLKAVPNDHIPDIFSQSHYLILPYKDVTQSGPLMLAFNYRTIPIVSKLPGFEELIIDGYNGYMFESENFLSLYELMSKIIKNHDQSYNNMINNLSEFVKNKYNIIDFKLAYLNMFNNTIDNRF
jgi:glycosyltransferase involved in cell wall biosynthesis